MVSTTQYIMDYAMQNQTFCIADLIHAWPKEKTSSLASIKSTITRLINSDRLARVKRGVYSFPTALKNPFKIVIGDKERQLNQLLKEKFPFATFCIYNGNSLAPLQHHLSFNNATYIETEKFVTEAAFDYLRDKGFEVFINPKSEMMNSYIDLKKAPIIIKSLKTESPTTDQDNIIVPTLEKILIDVQKDPDFSYLQGIESDYMLENAKALYLINQSRLHRYGKRRGLNLK